MSSSPSDGPSPPTPTGPAGSAGPAQGAGPPAAGPAGSAAWAGVAGPPAVLRVRAALTAAGADGDGVVVLDDHARTAAAAAEQLGVTVGQIANSLVFAVPDGSAAEGRRPLL